MTAFAGRELLAAVVLQATVLTMLLTGCTVVADKDQAGQTVKGYFDAVQAHDYETAAGVYAPQFYVKVPRDKWVQTLVSVNEKLGDLQTYQEKRWNATASATTSGSGSTVQFVYAVQYSKYPADETFTLSKAGGANTFQIVGHQINSDGFVQN